MIITIRAGSSPVSRTKTTEKSVVFSCILYKIPLRNGFVAQKRAQSLLFCPKLPQNELSESKKSPSKYRFASCGRRFSPKSSSRHPQTPCATGLFRLLRLVQNCIPTPIWTHGSSSSTPHPSRCSLRWSRASRQVCGTTSERSTSTPPARRHTDAHAARSSGRFHPPS